MLKILIENSNYNTNYTVGTLMDRKHAIVLIPLSFLWIFFGYTQAVLFTSILGKSANVFDPLNIYAVYDSWCDIQYYAPNCISFGSWIWLNAIIMRVKV